MMSFERLVHASVMNQQKGEFYFYYSSIYIRDKNIEKKYSDFLN